MNQDNEMPEGSPQPSGGSPDTTLTAANQEDPKEILEGLISAQPEPRRTELRQTVEQLFMGVVERGGSPKIDPETARILTASADRDNENKFKYLTQKQQDEAELERRELDFKTQKFHSQERFLWLIIPSVVFGCLGLIIYGLYLATHGHETLGVSILSAIITGIFAYLAGIGTANFFKHE